MIKDRYVLELLNEDLKGEYEAIELYDKHIQNIKDKEIIKVLIHIRDEEKEHVRELKELIFNNNKKVTVSRLKKVN